MSTLAGLELQRFARVDSRAAGNELIKKNVQ
jgi:hypothetical protein